MVLVSFPWALAIVLAFNVLLAAWTGWECRSHRSTLAMLGAVTLANAACLCLVLTGPYI